MLEDTKFFCPKCHALAIRNEETKGLSCPKCKDQPDNFIGAGINLYTQGIGLEKKVPDDFLMGPEYIRHAEF